MIVPGQKVRRLAHIGLTSHRANELATFFVDALGFVVSRRDRRAGQNFAQSFAVEGGANRITLSMGAQVLELLEFDQPGAAFPDGQFSNGLLFQHFAIAVSDMDRAYAQLSAHAGWKPISTGGPQQLPVSSGSVIAFKFRDPEGHPLELLQFPKAGSAHADRPFLGIDHSAISVAETARSIEFYGALGFSVVARSVNSGAPQQHLDDLPDVCVEVTALAVEKAAPHLELLCYDGAAERVQRETRPNDVAATRLGFECASSAIEGANSLAQDPDGHWLEFLV